MTDNENRKQRNESLGTTYTFRDKHGNPISTSDGNQITDNSTSKHHQLNSEVGIDSPSAHQLRSSRFEEEKSNRLNDAYEEQPSMLSNSELRSIDLNILGE